MITTCMNVSYVATASSVVGTSSVLATTLTAAAKQAAFAMGAATQGSWAIGMGDVARPKHHGSPPRDVEPV